MNSYIPTWIACYRTSRRSKTVCGRERCFFETAASIYKCTILKVGWWRGGDSAHPPQRQSMRQLFSRKSAPRLTTAACRTNTFPARLWMPDFSPEEGFANTIHDINYSNIFPPLFRCFTAFCATDTLPITIVIRIRPTHTRNIAMVVSPTAGRAILRKPKKIICALDGKRKN